MTVREGAKLGGGKRAGKFKPEASKTIAEMERLVKKGISVKRAGELVAKQGHGTSAEANRKLWTRRKSQ